MEEWRSTSYGLEVSDQLRVRYPKTGKVLKPHTNCGYLKICWTVNGKARIVQLHQLVADAFLTKPEHWQVIDHIDGNKLNNHPSNLRYCSSSDNNKNRGKSKKNILGEKGVTWDERCKAWRASWFQNNTVSSKIFSIKKYGDQAKDLALAYRIAREQEIGGYPNRQAPVIKITIKNYFAAAEQTKE